MRYLLEYTALRALLGIFAILPAPAASALGGAMFRTIGPLMGISRVAMRNMRHTFPDWDDARMKTTLSGMWDHLGRMIAEYPHLEVIARDRTILRGEEHLVKDGAALYAGGHIGNWEIMPPALLLKSKISMHPAYRAPNNPYVDRLIVKYRSCGGALRSFGKTRKGLAGIMQALQQGESIGMLIDQKMNTGVEMPFFGRPAMTSTAFVEMPRKLGCPLIPIRCVRLANCRFEIQTLPAIAVEGRTTEDVIADMHRILEDWITEHPEQWLWLHRRWKDK